MSVEGNLHLILARIHAWLQGKCGFLGHETHVLCCVLGTTSGRCEKEHAIIAITSAHRDSQWSHLWGDAIYKLAIASEHNFLA
jgi:hypothetical protein